MTSADNTQLCASDSSDVEGLWIFFCEEAKRICEVEPQMRILMDDVIFQRGDLAGAIAARLARKLAREDMKREEIFPLLEGVLDDHPLLVSRMAHDLKAINERDPACVSPMHPFLYYKGFMAISTYRVTHQLWQNGRHDLALYFQSLVSEVFGVDIHPAAQIGCGVFLDHATSVVIGETAIVEDNVSILHEVTLGGTGKVSGARHPVIRSGVLIGAGAKILGRVEIGRNSKVGAGSVVLDDVPPHKTVAGVPAVVVGESDEANPARDMNQSLTCCEI